MSKARKSQVEKFREAARDAETDDSEARFNATLKDMGGAKVCPECHHVFQGNGWDGIDAHWKAKHEAVMPYAEAWRLIKSGKYPIKT